VLSALRWVVPELRDVTAVDSIDTAVRRALAALDSRGVPAPASAEQILRYIRERAAG
jgi:hypothetical protein